MYLNPFEILVDRSERPAWTFANIYSDRTSEGKGMPIVVPISRMVLEHGDYTIAYHSDGIVVERKTVADFIASLTSRHKWFSQKVDAMSQAVAHPCIVAEGTMGQMAAACKASDQLKTIQRTIISWKFRYPKVHWFMMDGRRPAEICTFRLLERYWKLFVTQEVT